MKQVSRPTFCLLFIDILHDVNRILKLLGPDPVYSFSANGSPPPPQFPDYYFSYIFLIL